MNKNPVASRLKNIELSRIRKKIAQAPVDSINLALGELQFDTPIFIKKEAQRIIKNERIRYTQNAGLLSSREAICQYYDYKIEPEGVCITNGAEEAIFATLFGILNKNEEILLPDPTYPAYPTIINMLGGIVKYFPLDSSNNFTLERDKFIKQLCSNTKGIILCNPSNPTGTIFSQNELEFILNEAQKRDIIVIIDEIYRELYLEEKIRSALRKQDNLIVISGLSKSHCLTGWRIGWLVSSNIDLVKKITIAHQYISTCAAYVSQKLIPKALSEEGLNAILAIRKKLSDNYIALTSLFRTNLPYIKYAFPKAGPYLFIDLGINGNKTMNGLIEAGVIVLSGSIFGDKIDKYIRINYGLETEKLLKAGEKIINFIKKNIYVD